MNEWSIWRVKPKGLVHLWRLHPSKGTGVSGERYESHCGQIRDRPALTHRYPPKARRCGLCFPKDLI